MKKYNHAVEIAFTIDSDNDGDNVTEEEYIAGLEKRLADLKSRKGEALEACGIYDTYENEEVN